MAGASVCAVYFQRHFALSMSTTVVYALVRALLSRFLSLSLSYVYLSTCLTSCLLPPYTGSNAKKIQQLPDTTGMRSTVLADGASDTRWLTCVKVTGATVRLLGSANKPMAARCGRIKKGLRA